MSHCIKKFNISIHEVSKSLPKRAHYNWFRKIHHETPLCTCVQGFYRGSFTVEAAVVIPLVAGFLVSILFFFRVLQIETTIYSALSYASRKTASFSRISNSETASLAAAEAFFRKAVSGDERIAQYVNGGEMGISLLASDVSGDYIDLKVSYDVCMPIHFFGINGIPISQESKSRKWTGDVLGKTADEDRMVYVTSTGEVYHYSRTCNYLDLSIRCVKYAEIKGLRNKNEHKYYACDRCVAENREYQNVYITDYGTAYHSDLQCSGLKRTIYEVPLSEVGNRTACKKCADVQGSGKEGE